MPARHEPKTAPRPTPLRIEEFSVILIRAQIPCSDIH